MSKMNTSFQLTALAAAMLAVYGSAWAAEGDDIAIFTKPESSVSVGVGHLSGDRQQLGIFDGVTDDQTVLLLDAEVRMRDDDTGTWRTLSARNLGIDSREIRAGMEQQGNWGLGIGYSRIPREAPYTVNTGVQGIGTTSPVTPKPTTVPGSGADYQIGTERDILSLDFFKYLSPRLNFKVSFKNEEKDGTRHWGRGGQPEFAVEPIDSTTRQLEATLNYTGENLQLSGGYYGSWYNNRNTLVDTMYMGDNPAVLANHIYLSLPLDNQAQQVFLNGGYNFSTSTRGTFKVSYTHATQDEHLPTADIAGLALAGAPTSLDGEINTTLIQLGLTARPMPKLSVVANLRYHNVDDETPAHLIISSSGTDVHATPLSYETLSGKLEGTYRLGDGYNLVAGVDHSSQDRTVPVGTLDGGGVDTERYVPFRAELDETTYRVQLRRSLSETLNGALAFLHSTRDGPEYSEAHHSLGEINPVNIADRDRNKWRLSLDWTPMDRLGLQFNYEDAQDDYGPSSHEYGLREGNARLFSLDADFSLSNDWKVTAWYSHDDTKATQVGGRWDRVTEDHEADKESTLKDKGDSIGLSVNGQATPKLKLGAGVQWTRSKSRYLDVVTVDPANPGADPAYPAGVSPLPDIKNTMTKFNLYAVYALKKSADLRVDLIHERWRTDDWTWQFSDGSPFVYGTANDGSMVITDPKQTSTFVGIRYNYKFQ